VPLADASQGGLAWREVPGYLAAQLVGAFAGVATAHLMFGESVFNASRHVRSGGAQFFSEFVATFGLLCVIWGCARLPSSAVPFAVGAYITGPIGSRLQHPSPILPSPSRGWQATPSRASGRPTLRALSWRNYWALLWQRRCFAGWCRRCPKMPGWSSFLIHPNGRRSEWQTPIGLQCQPCQPIQSIFSGTRVQGGNRTSVAGVEGL